MLLLTQRIDDTMIYDTALAFIIIIYRNGPWKE